MTCRRGRRSLADSASGERAALGEPAPVGVIDTGIGAAASNVALDSDLLAARAAGQVANVLRWHRSRPAASVGWHQVADREVRVDYCRSHGIDIVRRPSSGGALYLDPGQLGFSLVLGPAEATRDAALEQSLARGARALAEALRRLGMAAAAKWPNDVEVAGRKIASVFAVRRGGALLLHGVVLFEADVETLLKVLRLPTEKLSADGLAAARERVTSIGEQMPGQRVEEALKRSVLERLAREFNLAVAGMPASLRAEAMRRAREADARAPLRIWADVHDKVEMLAKTPGGTLRMRADYGGDERRLTGVEFATDAHLGPAHFLEGLQADLEGAAVGTVAARVRRHADSCPLDAAGVCAEDFMKLAADLAAKRRFARGCGLDAARATALMPYSAARGEEPGAILSKASVVLVPYCAKPAWCKWRHRDGCSECGLCEVGDAYRAARERGLRVTTVTRYEHLVATLADMKASGVEAYIGMCCSHFFLKRHRAFAEAGMAAVLMDISGSNCYELRQEHLAYAGAFKAEAKLDGELVERVMRFVPRRGV